MGFVLQRVGEGAGVSFEHGEAGVCLPRTKARSILNGSRGGGGERAKEL